MNQMKAYKQNLGPAHEAALAMVDAGSKVLEVGCATGFMTKALTERLDCRVTAVEINESQAEEAEQYTAQMIVGDITDSKTWAEMEGRFDFMIFADVLEHLADPWNIVRKCRSVLAANGCVIASIPNIAYYKIRKDLLLGRFDYTKYGILDDTHLRFFTEKTCKALFEKNGYRIDRIVRVYTGRIDRALSQVSANAFTYQFVVKAFPTKDSVE